MEMEIKKINNKSIWEDFLLNCEEKTFLSSWNWGEFQEKMGNKIWRLGIYEIANCKLQIANLVAVALVTKVVARRGTFLLAQHAPVVMPNVNPFGKLRVDGERSRTINPFGKLRVDGERSRTIKAQMSNVFGVLLEELKRIGKEERATFIRMNPLWGKNQENQNILKSLGFKESSMHANAYEATWKLDLTPSEEEILMNMRKTTRYLIRQTQKNQDITVEKSENLDDLEIYQNLNMEVAKRQKFVPFSSEYIKNEFELFSKDNEALWLFGKYKGEVVAGVLVIFWSGIGFYHQAASLAKYAKFSIPYLLQWEAIKEAKRRSCSFYDFWGFTDPKKYPNHPWAGPTLFKMGFGGRVFEYVKTQDFPLSKKYWLTYFFEKMRKTKRGL